MSLVGTRPILQDELLKYELHHRQQATLMIHLHCRRLVFLPVGSFPGKDILWVKYWNVLAVVLLCILR